MKFSKWLKQGKKKGKHPEKNNPDPGRQTQYVLSDSCHENRMEQVWRDTVLKETTGIRACGNQRIRQKPGMIETFRKSQ